MSAFLVWLAFVLGWFLMSVLRDRVERFVPGVVAAGFVVVFGLHAVNPHALIVRTNVARAAAGAPIAKFFCFLGLPKNKKYPYGS